MATGTLPAVYLPKFDSPLEVRAKRAELERYEDTSRLSNLASQREYRINDLRRESGGDQNKLSDLMSKDPDFEVAEQGRKMKEALGKASSEQLDKISKTMKFTGQVLFSANEQSWGQAIETLNQAGVDTSKYPQTYDPAFAKRFAESTREYDKVVDDIRADKQMELTQSNADRTFDQTVKQNNATNARGWATINKPDTPKDPWVNDLDRGIQINTATGESRPITAGGTPIGTKTRSMSVTSQKELIQSEEEVQGGVQAIQFIKQAQDINKKAMGFTGAKQVASAGSLLPDVLRPQMFDDTQELDNIIQNTALPQLKAIFGGMPTEGERKVLLEMQGSSSKPAPVRKGIFLRAEQAARNRLKFTTEKSKRLREGTYFSGDPGVEQDTEQASPVNPLSVFDEADAIIGGQ